MSTDTTDTPPALDPLLAAVLHQPTDEGARLRYAAKLKADGRPGAAVQVAADSRRALRIATLAAVFEIGTAQMRAINALDAAVTVGLESFAAMTHVAEAIQALGVAGQIQSIVIDAMNSTPLED